MELVDHPSTHGARGEYLVFVLEEPDSGPQTDGAGLRLLRPDAEDRGGLRSLLDRRRPGTQGQGFGQLLLRFVENEVRRQSGRMLLIETSSKASYAPTLRFYQRSGYDEISRIKDFYRIEGDKIVFCKKLARHDDPRT